MPVLSAYVALGSNLGNSRQQVLSAFDALAQLPFTRLGARSRLYRTPPWGDLEQPAFVNAVALLDTVLSPHVLLDALLAIERRFGRIRHSRPWGPRTLDLDILHIPGIRLIDARLHLPHPRVAQRAFALLPLCDLAPDLELPAQGRADALLARLDASGCEILP